MRRSGRPRVAPLKFWRGDNIQYGVDDAGLPVAEGIVKGQALPEPASPLPRFGRRSVLCVCIFAKCGAVVRCAVCVVQAVAT